MPNSTATSRVSTRLALILTIAVALVFAGGPVSRIDVAAQNDGNGRVCSDHTLRGDYGLLASGIRQLPPFPGGPAEPFNATGMWTFHGDGTFTQAAGAAFRGLLTGNAPSPSEFPGTYSVNANCTGTMALYPTDIPFAIEYAIVIVDHAREIKGIVTSGGATSVSLTRK